MKKLISLALYALAVFPLAAGRAVFVPLDDPPRPAITPLNLDGCGPSTRAKYGEPVEIPGDPDKLKGWLHRTQKDDQGNVIEVWCIEIQGGVGNSFGYRYIPKGGNPVWFARCAFVGGQNFPSKKKTGDANMNGIPDGWIKLEHTSEDDSGGGAGDMDDDDGDPGKKDYDWEYDVASGNLKRWETLNGSRVRPDTPDFDGPAPQNFSGLFPSQLPGNTGQSDDMRDEPGVLVSLETQDADWWSYTLDGNDLTEFSPSMVASGDNWSLAAGGVISATAPAGWAVEFTDNYVTWVYVGPVPLNLSAGDPLSGFLIQSPAPRVQVYWLSDSAGELSGSFGYAGDTAGPGYRLQLPMLNR